MSIVSRVRDELDEIVGRRDDHRGLIYFFRGCVVQARPEQRCASALRLRSISALTCCDRSNSRRVGGRHQPDAVIGGDRLRRQMIKRKVPRPGRASGRAGPLLKRRG